MVKEIRYTSIRRVLDDLLDHPMMRDLSLEQVVRYAIRFLQIHGYSKLYQDRIDDVEIKEFRGVLPCDLVSIVQVKDCRTGVCLRAMTDNFPMGVTEGRQINKPKGPQIDPNTGEVIEERDMYIPPLARYCQEPAFKTQGRIIYTSFPEGLVSVAYKAIPVDEDGFPMLIDNENYIAALEAYIKKQVFTIKFDTGKIAGPILQNAQRDYAWLAAQLRDEFQTPSLSEAEAISRAMTHLIPRVREFDNGFKHLGDREYIRRHDNTH